MKNADRDKLELYYSNCCKEIFNLKNKIEAANQELYSSKKDLLLDIIQIIDTFEQAEKTIKERGWDKLTNIEQPINRLLTAKRKTISILEKHKVSKIAFEDNLANDDFCRTIDVEPDNQYPNHYIISIEKEGYLVDGEVLRVAEVIAVKN